MEGYISLCDVVRVYEGGEEIKLTIEEPLSWFSSGSVHRQSLSFVYVEAEKYMRESTPLPTEAIQLTVSKIDPLRVSNVEKDMLSLRFPMFGLLIYVRPECRALPGNRRTMVLLFRYNHRS